MRFDETTKRRAQAIAALLGGAAAVGGCGGDAGSNGNGGWAKEATLDLAIQSVGCPAASEDSTHFFVPAPDPGAFDEARALLRKGDLKGALDLAAMLGEGHAVWLTGGTPHDAWHTVAATIREARVQRRTPILVAYDVPYRDCQGLSAGGAADTAAYEAWIDGFAAGIGNARAVVVLEPDSLGIIPYNTTIFGATDACQPTVIDATGATVPAPGADPTDRYAQLAYALVRLATKAPNAKVYVDGTHSAWLGVSEAAFRINHLTTTATQTAQAADLPFDPSEVGFFLDVSNFQPIDQLIQFGTWVSDCIAAATVGASWAIGNFTYCPGQYDAALNFAIDYTPAYEATVTAGLQNMLGGASATTRFIIDTGRNGQGTLDPTPYGAAPFDQPASVLGTLASGSWCNPPGAGVGLRPTMATLVPLLDAYAWIKVPGESDGTCDSAAGVRACDYSLYNPWGIDSTAQLSWDPLWGQVDPTAGGWFANQALQLAENANPPFIH